MTDCVQNIEFKVFKRERKIAQMTLWSANDTPKSGVGVVFSAIERAFQDNLGNKLLFGAIGYYQQLIYMT